MYYYYVILVYQMGTARTPKRPGKPGPPKREDENKIVRTVITSKTIRYDNNIMYNMNGVCVQNKRR